MDGTLQVNLRLSKNLLYDMEFITSNLGLNRSEWLKVALSRIIATEKLRIIEVIEDRYIHGRITREDFKRKLGCEPNTELQKRKTEYLRTLPVSQQTGMEEAKKALQKYIQEIARKTGEKGERTRAKKTTKNRPLD